MHIRRGKGLCSACKRFDLEYRETKWRAEQAKLRREIRSLKALLGTQEAALSASKDTVTVPIGVFVDLYLTTADFGTADAVDQILGRDFVDELIRIKDGTEGQ